MTERFDVHVVGSGPNGLAAAIRLVQTGRSVCVHELDDAGGGPVELTESGFHHDVCASVLPMALPPRFSMRFSSRTVASIGSNRPPLWSSTRRTRRHAGVASREPQKNSEPIRRTIFVFPDRSSSVFIRWSSTVAPLDCFRRFSWPALAAWSTTRNGLRAERSRRRRPGHSLQALPHSVLPLDRRPSAAIGLMLHYAAHAVGWPIPKGGAASGSRPHRGIRRFVDSSLRPSRTIVGRTRPGAK